ncbi:hypothetical protein CQ018_12350 [Arthrobacter sp. MYb227]|uniref:hypothetical protein n=1 Tax=Arthrobacter sp. MYb227 TaxID=1848601 RepID=UPI000CFC4DDC|nr:hypothetical protein [Arthrobacter sp. MYb227]PQZ92288.1 hypothetical protein CQ018_12350 [Arthrobacter sp. MYb227]
MLIASLALIFDQADAATAHQRISETLKARAAISLLAAPVSWGAYAVVEMVLAVNPDGYIIMADAAGNTSFGQQIEGFAIALKRGTGAKYADFDGADAESGEPIEDPALEHPSGGRSVLIGALKESEVSLFAGATSTAWNYLSTEHGPVAVHEGYMPEIMLSKSVFPAVMLSHIGPRYSMVFWFASQGRKLHGFPAFGHGWSVASEPVLATLPGTPAADVTEFLTREWLAPDTESIGELSEYGLAPEIIDDLVSAFSGSGSMDKVRDVLTILGHAPELADYLDAAELPADARLVEPRGLGGTIATSMSADARVATGWRKFFNVLSWRPRSQIMWGAIQALIAVAFLTLTDWNDPWATQWIAILVTAYWGIDSLTNLGIGFYRVSGKKKGR